MRAIRETSKFKRDVKRMQKRGKDFSEFKIIIEKLASGQKLDLKYRDHLLVGEYKGSRECLTDELLVSRLFGTHCCTRLPPNNVKNTKLTAAESVYTGLRLMKIYPSPV
jgi:mRNA interferase YafQ